MNDKASFLVPHLIASSVEELSTWTGNETNCYTQKVGIKMKDVNFVAVLF